MNLEQKEGGPSRREIIYGIRQELQTGNTLLGHELDDFIGSIENANRGKLEVMKAHYQTSSEKGPATREMEASPSKRLGHFEKMESLLDQLIALTPEDE